jgi:hypothetical protein
MDKIKGVWAVFLALPCYVVFDELFNHQSWLISLPLFGESILFRISLYIVGIGALIAGFHHNPEHDDSVFLHNLILLGLGGVMIYICLVPSETLQIIALGWFWGIPYWSLVFIAVYTFIGSILLPLLSYAKKIRENITQNQISQPENNSDSNQTFIMKMEPMENYDEEKDMLEIFA